MKSKVSTSPSTSTHDPHPQAQFPAVVPFCKPPTFPLVPDCPLVGCFSLFLVLVIPHKTQLTHSILIFSDSASHHVPSLSLPSLCPCLLWGPRNPCPPIFLPYSMPPDARPFLYCLSTLCLASKGKKITQTGHRHSTFTN